jgi:hypothetical protein
MMEEGIVWGGADQLIMSNIYSTTLLVRKGMTTSPFRSNVRYLFSGNVAPQMYTLPQSILEVLTKKVVDLRL